MAGTSIELSDLPPEMLQLLVEKCDFITRRRLRASSSLMNQVVDSTNLYIPSVGIGLWGDEAGVLVELTIKLFKDDYTLHFEKNETGGTRILSDFRKEVLIENSNPMDEAVDWFRQMCLQKNVTIGQLIIESIFNSKKMERTLDLVLRKSGIKIESILCLGQESVDLMWKFMEYCDKKLLKVMIARERDEIVPKPMVVRLRSKQHGIFSQFRHGNVSQFRHEIVKNLEQIEINCHCDVSDDDVLSFNASVISLKSENFTDGLVYNLIEKFTNRREEGSVFCIENSQKRNLDLEMIPPGFKETNSTNEYKEYRHQLIETNHPTVYIRVSEDRVRLQIGDTKKANFWNEDGRMYINAPEYDYDSSEYDAYDDFDDLESEYYGNPYASDPDYDLLDDRAFGESDFEDDEDEY